MDWFLYDNGLRHVRVKVVKGKENLIVQSQIFHFVILFRKSWLLYLVFKNLFFE